MSRPRKPFGARQPGRLPATMMKVLAAEMSDPSRLRRGKQYAKDGSVLDIVVEPGAVVCTVQGSRPTPYVATIEVTRGDGMPLRRDITTSCTCPDDDNWHDHACKHVLAAMFSFSDELLIEPELLDHWRGRAVDDVATADDAADATTDDDTTDDETTDDATAADRTGVDRPSRRHLRLVGEGERRLQPVATSPPQPAVDPLAGELAIPDGSSLPDVPPLEPLDPLPPRDPQLAAVLRSALAAVRFDWD